MTELKLKHQIVCLFMYLIRKEYGKMAQIYKRRDPKYEGHSIKRDKCLHFKTIQ